MNKEKIASKDIKWVQYLSFHTRQEE